MLRGETIDSDQNKHTLHLGFVEVIGNYSMLKVRVDLIKKPFLYTSHLMVCAKTLTFTT